MENDLNNHKYWTKDIFESKIKSIINTKELNINDYKPKEILNPNIWDGLIMHDEVRKHMLFNAYEFINFLKLPDLKMNDIILTGSIANYNWNKYSDIDIHIVFDFKQISSDIEFVNEFLKTKKELWNDIHQIKIKGFDVEMYCQDTNEPHTSTGIFSLINNKWNSIPIKQIITLDVNNIKHKTLSFIDMFNNITQIKNPETLISSINKIKDKLKKYRTIGLEEYGEFSTENIVYKILRNLKFFDKLKEIKNNTIDSKLTLENEKI